VANVRAACGGERRTFGAAVDVLLTTPSGGGGGGERATDGDAKTSSAAARGVCENTTGHNRNRTQTADRLEERRYLMFKPVKLRYRLPWSVLTLVTV